MFVSLILTKTGCVDLLINILSSEQPALAALPDQPVRADAGAAAHEVGPSREGGDDAEEREAGAREDRGDTEAEGADDGDASAAENEEASAPANAAPRIDTEDHRARGGASVSQLAASILAHIAATSDAASEGPGLLKVESVQRILSHMAATWCDAITRDRHTFSKVLCIVNLYSKYTRALTFQNLCQSHRHSPRGAGRPPTGRSSLSSCQILHSSATHRAHSCSRLAHSGGGGGTTWRDRTARVRVLGHSGAGGGGAQRAAVAVAPQRIA